jgi:hypothetical protein
MNEIRPITVLLVILALVIGVALPAAAANVSADCFSGGQFVTMGRADYWQDHTHDGFLTHYWYDGVQQYRSRDWGFHTGTQYGTVNGPNLSYAGARCPS